MATYNLGNTGVNPKGGFQWSGTPKVTVIEVVVDLSKRTGLNVPPAGYTNVDVLQLADFPKGTYIVATEWELLTAEGSAATFTLATTGTALTLVTGGASLNGTANVIIPGAAGGQAASILVDSVLTMTLAGTLTNAGTAKVAFHFLAANLATNA